MSIIHLMSQKCSLKWLFQTEHNSGLMVLRRFLPLLFLDSVYRLLVVIVVFAVHLRMRLQMTFASNCTANRFRLVAGTGACSSLILDSGNLAFALP